MKKTITVLGATGKVGGKISEILLKERHHLKLITQTSDKLRKLENMGARIIPADITDADVLTKAFENADSVYVFTPPNFTAVSYREFQRKVGNSVVEAIKKSCAKYIVNLSSCGGHMHEGNGIIAGLAEQEVKLNQLEDVNVMHLRPAYFMDNFLLSIPLIKEKGINGSTAVADHKIPMVATKDIATIAASHLVKQDFKGKSVQPILGDRDYSFREFTSIIGILIGKRDLHYVQFPTEQAKHAMTSQGGLSADVANDIIRMETSLKNGIMNYECRTPANSSPTSAEIFVKETFLPLYNSL
ncbi:MAG: NmrA family NAD(P)-binding protein [Bacteroidota bacterium]